MSTEEAQRRFQVIWNALAVPEEQRVRLAAKYGSQHFSEKVVTV